MNQIFILSQDLIYLEGFASFTVTCLSSLSSSSLSITVKSCGIVSGITMFGNSALLSEPLELDLFGTFNWKHNLKLQIIECSLE